MLRNASKGVGVANCDNPSFYILYDEKAGQRKGMSRIKYFNT